nr:MAG TPA: hypothetical protein [Caudoviricetes sp.]
MDLFLSIYYFFEFIIIILIMLEELESEKIY